MFKHQARLTRIAANPREGTFGSLVLNGQPICNSLEPYSRDNQRRTSCINEGQYIVKKHKSPTYGDTYMITDIQGRDLVLFHWGNRARNSEGCIVLGEEFGELYGDWAVLSSKKAFNEFIEKLDGCEEFLLTIKDAY
tara:strand:- start:1185 stop:1595 length:411 start_codon:yes stop_codon:yes gene_type:complete